MSVFSWSSSPAQQIFQGDSASVGNGTVRTWVEVDGGGTPLRIGTSLTSGALIGLPGSEQSFSLDLPQVTIDSLFKHVYFNWNPAGHPSLYFEPHFDAHFYVVTSEVREAVAQGFDIYPEPQFLAPDYIPDSDPPFAVLDMGSHWADSTSGVYHGEMFTQTFLYGYYEGSMYFFEPMFTVEYLQSQPADTVQVKQPPEYQFTGYVPTTCSYTYNDTAGTYEIVLGDFIYRVATGVDEQSVPQETALRQNYPNPFNPTTTIVYTVKSRESIVLKVFDVLGREVATLVNEQKEGGTYKVQFDATDIAGGVYFYRMHAGNFVETRKLLLLK